MLSHGALNAVPTQQGAAIAMSRRGNNSLALLNTRRKILFTGSKQSKDLPNPCQWPNPALSRKSGEKGAAAAAPYLYLAQVDAPYSAESPSSSAMRINWLYFAFRSERQGAPVLIWPQFVATAMSAIVASSVSPDR